MSVFTPKKQVQARALCDLMLPTFYEYFRDIENKIKFEVWYEQRYGEPYEWKGKEE